MKQSLIKNILMKKASAYIKMVNKYYQKNKDARERSFQTPKSF